MANSSTDLGVNGLILPRSGSSKVYIKTVVLDTPTSDLIVHSPEADKYAALLSMTFAETSGLILTVKSGSTSIASIGVLARQLFCTPVSNTPILVCQKGEDLIFNTSVAITLMQVAVAEFEYLNLGD